MLSRVRQSVIALLVVAVVVGLLAWADSADADGQGKGVHAQLAELRADVEELRDENRGQRVWLLGLSENLAYVELETYRRDRRLIRCARHALAGRDEAARRCLGRVVR